MTVTVIGEIDCPDCGFDKVPFKESSKRQWATYTCPECGSQHFARSDKSNKAMRKRARLFDGSENQTTTTADEEENLEQEVIEEEDDDKTEPNGGTYWS